MKIYTKTGDRGETGLFGGLRVPKDDARVEAYGDVDELNSTIGAVRAELSREHEGAGYDIDGGLMRIQSELFDLGAELARDPAREPSANAPRIDDEAVRRLEQAIDLSEKELPPLTSFVLPGGTRAAALLHLARTVCRRAERRVVSLQRSSPVRDVDLRYLNRLSDLLFVLARLDNRRASVDDVPWIGADRRGTAS